MPDEDGGVIPSSPPHITVALSEVKDSQEVLMAPTKIMQKDKKLLPTIKPDSLNHQEKRKKRLVYILTTVVILSILILVLGLTILRADSPGVILEKFHVKNLQFGTVPFATLDMDMVSEVTIGNANLLGSFKFHNSSSSVFYGDATLGVTDINGGHVIEARGNKVFNITVQVRSNNAVLMNTTTTTTNFTSDVVTRLVPMRIVTNLRGEVETVKIIHSKTTGLMSCTLKLNLSSQDFQDIKCH